MRKKSLHRGILLTAGFIAAAVIIFSYVLPTKETSSTKKAATEQNDKQENHATIHAPSEAVTPVSGVQVDERIPVSLLEVLAETPAQQAVLPVIGSTVGLFLKNLFRVIISPNAP